MITGDKVIKMCIGHKYYTCGSREHYENMLCNKIVRKEINEEIFSVDEIRDIATDIYYHSNYTEDEAITVDGIVKELEQM